MVLPSKEKANDSITVFDKGIACFRFTLSTTLLKPALIITDNAMNAFYEVEMH